MKLSIKYLTFYIFLISIISCSGDSIPAEENVVFKAYLNGGNATPVNNSAGMGIATLTFNPNTNGFSMIVQYSGVSATCATIYNQQDVNTMELIDSYPGLASETTSYGSLNSDQKEDLNANKFRLNMNSSTYPDGEICGPLIRQNNDGFPPPPPGKIQH